MIGIVAEGPADVAVIRNILKGRLGIDRDLTYAIRPILTQDETDLAGKGSGFRPQSAGAYSNWLLVLEECKQRTRIEDFLRDPIDDVHLVVIHLDTAEAHLPGFDLSRPDRRDPAYTDLLRALVVKKIDALLGPTLASKVRHAIAVEETDAWVLTIHDSDKTNDTGLRPNAKKRLEFVLGKGKKVGGGKTAYELYKDLTRDLRDARRLGACADRNRSLRLFIDSL